MVSLGVGEIVGAIGMGFIVDHIGAKRSSVINVVLIGIAGFSVILFLALDSYSVLAYFMTFLWGVQDSSISIHLDAILGFEFESNKTPFSCDVLIEAIVAFSFGKSF